jgi:hypothetical protein
MNSTLSTIPVTSDEILALSGVVCIGAQIIMSIMTGFQYASLWKEEEVVEVDMVEVDMEEIDTPEKETLEPYDMEDLLVMGLTGIKRSGKDTMGHRLVTNHGFVRVAFADPLKEACIDIFGFSKEQLYGDDLKEVIDDYWKYTPRDILQKVGTELFRTGISQSNVLPSIGKNIWVRALERKIINLANQGHRRFVITDVRFPNELEFLSTSNFNSYSVKVIRDDINKSDKLESGNHTSESSISSFKCNFYISNNGTIDDLNAATDQIIDMID